MTKEQKKGSEEAAAAEQSTFCLTKEIEVLDAASLKPIPTNPRRHSRANIAKIAASIRTYGWTTPVLVTDGLEVIAGHGRLLAAAQLGQTEIPCIRLSHLTPELVEAYRIADNRLALDSEWDDQLLTEAIRRLAAEPSFDLTVTGFDKAEIEDFLFIQGSGLTGDDDVPPAEAEVVSSGGDIWQLGGHRLMCGDCTSPVAVSRLLEGAAPVIMVTDPPYGVQYDATWRSESRLNRSVSKRENAAVLNDDRADWREAWSLFHGAIAYVWHSGIHGPRVAESLLVTGLELRSQICWVKDRITIGRGHYHWQHEGCWYAVRRGSTAHWEGGRDQSTVWEFRNLNFEANNTAEDTTEGHSTQKPTECMRRPLANHTRKGELAYDPFMGSGTTLIAAESLGRRAYGLEINPAYVDIAIRRWQAYTGNVARLVATLAGPTREQRTFDEEAQWRKEK